MTKRPEKGESELTDEAKREAERTGKDICDILKEMLKKAKAAKDKTRARKITRAQKYPGLPEQAQTGKEAMSLWYTAHLLMYVKRKDGTGGKCPVWENLVLIKANSEAEAFTKAERRGKEDEGDEEGSFRWGGKPAQWVFAGIRKLTLCEDPEKRPGDGTEISYTEMEVASEQAVGKLLQGEPVSVKFRESFADGQPKDPGSKANPG